MFIRLFLLFTIVPLMELWLLIKVGERIGAGETILLVVATGAVGAYLARQQGLAVIADFQRRTGQGEMPTDPIIDGLMILIGGLLLVTPGVVTDVVGFSLVIPLSRALLREGVKKWVKGQIVMAATDGQVHTWTYRSGPGQSGGSGPKNQGTPPLSGHARPRRPTSNDDDVIDV